jgi:hypothetical protein
MKLRNVLLMSTTFLIGGLTSAVVGIWHPYVTVKAKNVSQQPLTEIELRFQNTEGKGVFNLYVGDSLKTGEEMKFHFYVGGEGAFAIKAKFDDDHIVEGIGGYVELGDTKSIEIHRDAIKVTRKTNF